MNDLTIVMGVAAIIASLMVVLWRTRRKDFWMANFILCLVTIAGRAVLIYYIAPFNNGTDAAGVATIRNSLGWLMGWLAISVVLVGIFHGLVPFIHRNYVLVKTPPGQKDRTILLDDYRRSA